MISNYFKTAIRNLFRNKTYAAINIIGLAIGIAACLLIFCVLRFETSFDNFHPKKDRIYRVVSEFKNPEGTFHSQGVPFPVANALRTDLPQLKNVGAILGYNEQLVTIESAGNRPPKKFMEEDGFFFAEPEFFDIFHFPLLAGDKSTALVEPNTALLTKETAEKYFGDWKNALGKSITHSNRTVLKVTGILENVPANSDFPLSVVASHSTLKNLPNFGGNMEDWVSTWSNANTYVEFPENLSPAQFNSQLAVLNKKYKPAEYAKDGLIIQHLSDIHFDDRFGNFKGRTFSKSLITALIVIGIFLVVIACVNFVNLATAQAVNRSREVGVRKVLGSNRLQLAVQFLSETLLITVTSLIVAVAFASLALPFLNELLQIKLSLGIVDDPSMIIFLIAVAIIVTALSGAYPAIILSGFNPITALKSKVTAKMMGGISLRRGLVILQFAISQILINGTLIVVSQMDYFREASLGFSKGHIMNVPIPSDSVSRTKIEMVRHRLEEQPGIQAVSFSFASPSDNGGWNSDFKFDNSPKNTEFSANLKWADPEYFSLYNLEFVAGKPYQESDTVREVVVNENLLKKVGISNPEEAIGKKLDFWDGRLVATVGGVIKDFHSYSLRDPISPIVLGSWKRMYQLINIKVKPESVQQTLAAVERIWNETYPQYVYEHEFLDEKINNFYRQENQLSQLYKIFAGIAIFISCLGLYGLISFMAAQRTKEVGIRKVLGASVSRIVFLFSKEFLFLIAIAFLLAAPIAYYIMHSWLQDFSFRITMGPEIFVLTIVISIVIAWLTVGYRAIRAAIANPVKSLRTE